MRITSKGQVTIPIEIREKLGLLPNTEVEFEVRGNTARLVRAQSPRAANRGATIVARLRGSGDLNMSTDEILGLMRGRR
jgi:AbrB family looped-hinge helix DNA binding protein